MMENNKQAPPALVVEEIDRKRMRLMNQAFLEVHAARLQFALTSLNGHQREFLTALPLLLHTNHPKLPGYINKTTPCGFSDYVPSQDVLQTTEKWANGPAYDKHLEHPTQLLGLYVVGNIGSLSFSQSSPITLWLCYQDLSESALAELLQKTILITAFAKKRNLELNFYLIEPNNFKKGIITKPAECAEEIIYPKLLLDEFYRTGLWLAGRTPLWWSVPPLFEPQYEAYATILLKNRFIEPDTIIDFGGIDNLPPEEYVNAALSEVYKAIDNPYPAILNLILLEYYINSYPETASLSLSFKEAIYNNQKQTVLDNDLQIFDIIYDHLMSQNNVERLTLAKKCFYFKINEPLSLAINKESQTRRPKIAALINTWGWDIAFLKQLDKRANWKIETVLQESNRLAYEISNCYRFVTNFAQGISSTQKLLNPQEMVLLGRKIYTAFERRQGKIENINLGVSKDLSEEELNLIEIVREKEESQWEVARASLEDDIPQIPFKHASSILELSAWLIYNGIHTKKTKLSVESSNADFKKDKFSTLFENLNGFLADISKHVQKKSLKTASALKKAMLLINLGTDILSEHPDSLTVIEETFDPFCFGQDRRNMVMLIEQLSLNSWQEVLVTRFLGPNCVEAWLEHFLSHSANPFKKNKTEYSTMCLYNVKNNLFANRFEKLIIQLQKHFLENPHAASLRYFLPFGTGFLMAQFQEQKPQIAVIDSQISLIHRLADIQEKFSPVFFDNYLGDNSLLGELFSKQTSEKLCLFYLRAGEKAIIYIIDENGSLFIDRVPYRNAEQLVNGYGHFFINIKTNEQDQDRALALADIGLFFEVHQKQDGLRVFVPREKFFDPDLDPAFEIKATAIFDFKGGLTFNIKVNKLLFSTTQDGHSSYLNAAKHIVAQRPSKEKYECRLSHLDLSILEKDRKNPFPTSVYLQHKKTVESLLNFSLDRIK